MLNSARQIQLYCNNKKSQISAFKFIVLMSMCLTAIWYQHEFISVAFALAPFYITVEYELTMWPLTCLVHIAALPQIPDGEMVLYNYFNSLELKVLMLTIAIIQLSVIHDGFNNCFSNIFLTLVPRDIFVTWCFTKFVQRWLLLLQWGLNLLCRHI